MVVIFANRIHVLSAGSDLADATAAVRGMVPSTNPGSSLYHATYQCLDWLNKMKV